MKSNPPIVFDNGIELQRDKLICFHSEFPLNEITSLQVIGNKSSYRGPLLMGLMGVLFFWVEWLIGLVFIALSLFWWWSNKKIYTLRVHTRDGRKFNALIHRDKAFLQEVLLKTKNQMEVVNKDADRD
nr:hypothetical protein [Saprospiraceae bacterium]